MSKLEEIEGAQVRQMATGVRQGSAFLLAMTVGADILPLEENQAVSITVL